MTSLFTFSPSESLAVLRALKTVAMADGKFAVKEQAMLVSSAELLGLPADTADTAEPVTPPELAAQIIDQTNRTLALKACLVMGIVDGQISPEEWKVLSDFRRGLGIDEAELQTFHGLVNDHRQLTRFQYERHLAAPRRTLYASEGWQGVLQFFAEDVPFAHLTAARENSELAHRYRQIGNLPDGTLGHALHRHYREREFAFAGEPGGVPEALVHHDIIHILSGYDTDFDGELQTLAFTAGMRREDPFSALFLVLLQFTAGYKVTPTGTLASPRTFFDAERILRALQRGRRTVIDFSGKRDFWDVMDQTVASLRQHYGVPLITSAHSGAMPAAAPAT